MLADGLFREREMRELGILFNTEMVKAILDGRKTQTRRLIKPQPYYANDARFGNLLHWKGHQVEPYHQEEKMIFQSWLKIAPYQVGDHLIPCVIIQDTNEKYCASFNGDIYSCKCGEWKKLKPFTQSRGYKCVSIITADGKKSRNVHTLVCEAFHGEKPDKGYQVRHLDGDSQNNIASNLKWGTQYENWSDRKSHGNGIEGEKHLNAKFTDCEREHIKWAINNNLCSIRHASRILNVRMGSIQSICNPKELCIPSPKPEKAARIWLEVTNVRVERIQDISDKDAKAEGMVYIPCKCGMNCQPSYVEQFEQVWDSTVKKPEHKFEANPYVWVYKFKRIK